MNMSDLTISTFETTFNYAMLNVVFVFSRNVARNTSKSFNPFEISNVMKHVDTLIPLVAFDFTTRTKKVHDRTMVEPC